MNAGSWILSAGGAVDFPHANWDPDFRIGIGSRAEVGFPMGGDTAAGLGLSYFHYQGNNGIGPILIDEVRVVPFLRVYLTQERFNPYLTGGLGVTVQFAADSGVITPHLNPDGFVGLGFEERLAAQEAAFFEVNFTLMDAGDLWTQDFEAVAGLRSGF